MPDFERLRIWLLLTPERYARELTLRRLHADREVLGLGDAAIKFSDVVRTYPASRLVRLKTNAPALANGLEVQAQRPLRSRRSTNTKTNANMEANLNLKHVILASFLTFGAIGAYAQTSPNGASPPPASAHQLAPAPDAADAGNLIGRSIQNANNDTIGKIESVYIDPHGKVDSVMVGVGGFLGVGTREVRLGWKDLHIADNGKKVTVDMTKDQLKALPEYKYSNTASRGHVFSDNGPVTADQRAASDTRTTSDQTANANRANTTESTGDFNVSGDMAGSAIIGATVKNANRDSVGTVDDLYVDSTGRIKSVVLSVGGFLGVGSKDVAVKWSDIKYGRNGNSVVLTTDVSKEALKALPDYKYERRQPAGREQAAAPPATPEKK